MDKSWFVLKEDPRRVIGPFIAKEEAVRYAVRLAYQEDRDKIKIASGPKDMEQAVREVFPMEEFVQRLRERLPNSPLYVVNPVAAERDWTFTLNKWVVSFIDAWPIDEDSIEEMTRDEGEDYEEDEELFSPGETFKVDLATNISRVRFTKERMIVTLDMYYPRTYGDIVDVVGKRVDEAIIRGPNADGEVSVEFSLENGPVYLVPGDVVIVYERKRK